MATYILTLSLSISAVLALILAARRLNPLARTLVLLQAGFWLLAYSIRSIYFVVEQPGWNSPLRDYRFIKSGYVELSTTLLGVVAVGLGAYCLALSILPFARHKRRDWNLHRNFSGMSTFLIALLALNWVGRLTQLYGFGGALQTFTAFNTFAGGTALLLMPLKTKKHTALLMLLIVTEGTWALLSASKTPLLTLILAAAIRLAHVWSGRKLGWFYIAAATAALAVFALLQPLKGIDTAAQVTAQGGSAFGGAAVAVLQRTDLLTPMADAYLFTHAPWLSGREVASSVLTGAFPTGVHETVGIRWTEEVRALTQPSQTRGVSIAPGFIAEGYALAGWFGVLVEALLVAVILSIAARGMYSSRLPVVAFCSAYIFSSSMYEGGVLSITQVNSGALRSALLAFLISLLVKHLQRNLPLTRQSFPKAQPTRRRANSRPSTNPSSRRASQAVRSVEN